MTTWESTRKHFRFTTNHLKSIKKLFLQIILIWLLPTTTSVRCMTTWESTRKHFCFTTNHLKFDKKLFLQIILILANSYNNIGSMYDNMGEYSKALSFYEKSLEIRKKLFLQIIFRWLLPTATSVVCLQIWKTIQKHFHIFNVHLTFGRIHYLLIILIFKVCERVLKF